MVSTLFFVLTKVVGVLFRLETLLVVLCLLAIVAIRRVRVRRATGWIGSVIAVIVATSVWPVGNLVLAPLERAYPASPALGDVQGIIVLGGAEYDGTLHSGGVAQVNSAGDRFITTMELAHRFPDARVLWSGGRATIAGSAEAYSPGVEILLRMGLAEERLLVENRSRNTTENAHFSRDLLPDALSGQWVLVTSAFHMPRSVGTFCQAGWSNLVPWPVDHRAQERQRPQFDLNLQNANKGLREWIGLLGYKAAGRWTDPASVDCLDQTSPG